MGKTRNHSPVRREGGRTRAVVRVMGGEEGGGYIGEKVLRDQDLRGRDHLGVPSSTPPPPPHTHTQLSNTTRGTAGERDPRRQGARAGRVRGGHPGIGRSPSETGGQ